jgi:hypothetical protein
MGDNVLKTLPEVVFGDFGNRLPKKSDAPLIREEVFF